MRLSVRAWETAVITLLVLLVVGTTTAVHMSRLGRVVVEEASREFFASGSMSFPTRMIIVSGKKPAALRAWG